MFQKAKEFLSGVSAGEEPLDLPDELPPTAAFNPPAPRAPINDEIECGDAFIPNVIIDQPQLSYRAPNPQNPNLGLDRDPFTQNPQPAPTPEPKSFFQPTDYKPILKTVSPFTSRVSDSTRDQTITGYHDNNPYNSILLTHPLRDNKLLSKKSSTPTATFNTP